MQTMQVFAFFCRFSNNSWKRTHDVCICSERPKPYFWSLWLHQNLLQHSQITNKCRSPMENPRKSGKGSEVGCVCGGRGVLKPLLPVNIIKRSVQKLRRNTLFHFGLITWRFIFGEPENSSYPWFSDLVDVTMTSKTSHFQFWRHQDTSNNSRRNRESFLNNNI